MDDPQDHRGRSRILTGTMVAYVVIAGLILLALLLFYLSFWLFAASN
jgi:hypothetical protein